MPDSITPIHLTDESFKQVLQDAGDKPVLVDFWAAWCGPCKMIAPIIESLAEEYKDKAVITKLDTDEYPDTAKQFGVMSIPTLFVFKNGEVVDQIIGFTPKPAVQALLDKHLV